MPDDSAAAPAVRSRNFPIEVPWTIAARAPAMPGWWRSCGGGVALYAWMVASGSRCFCRQRALLFSSRLNPNMIIPWRGKP